MRLRRYEVRAIDHDDTPTPGLQDTINAKPRRFFLRATAQNAANYYMTRDGFPCHFFVVKVMR